MNAYFLLQIKIENELNELENQKDSQEYLDVLKKAEIFNKLNYDNLPNEAKLSLEKNGNFWNYPKIYKIKSGNLWININTGEIRFYLTYWKNNFQQVFKNLN